MARVYYAYVLASPARRLYVGMTNNLVRRMKEHRSAEIDTYVGRFGITKLVRAEPFPTAMAAISREKQLKRWSRAKKLVRVEQDNPQWRDLSAHAAMATMLR